MTKDDLSDLTGEELLLARQRVLDEFATALVTLHIDCGAPPHAALAKQAEKDDRCRLPKSTLSEVFNGKKLPSIDFTVELIRQLRPDETGLLDEWRERWSQAKYAITRIAKEQKNRERAEKARGQGTGDVDRLREEAAAELQRASLLRVEAEKALTDAQAEAATVLATAQQAARSTELNATARAEEILAQAREEAEQIRRQAQRQAALIEAPALSQKAERALYRPLSEEFTELTTAHRHALVRPELVPAPEPLRTLPEHLGDLWRTLHLLALRLPTQDAEHLRARWRAMATDILYGVDGDGLVPGLPGIVQALQLRDLETNMTQIAIRDHSKALLERRGLVNGLVDLGSGGPAAGKLRYLLALIEEYAGENLLLARYDPSVVVALEYASEGRFPVRHDHPERIGHRDVMDRYRRHVAERLTNLARSLGDEDGAQTTVLVKADEVLAALVPDPVPGRDSWWYRRRRALQKKVTLFLAPSGVEVQAHGALFPSVTDEQTQNNIVSEQRAGETILWWIRLPYRVQDGSWEKGRMICERRR